MRQLLILLGVLISMNNVFAKDTLCINVAFQHDLISKELKETRNYWISLPYGYSDTLGYPVIYVLDAEWRFDLVRHIAFDLGVHGKIQKSIIVGIPHIEPEFQRGVDLTFSSSGVEYDGEVVDSTWYNPLNSGGAQKFYKYLVKELIPEVNKQYATNGHETLVGHSYGGYFGGYLLGLEHPFEVIHMYDPSIWYGNGEVIEILKANSAHQKNVKIHITYQTDPTFHKEKIEAFISELGKRNSIVLTQCLYKEETHNSLFMDSFIKGIQLTNISE